MKRNNKQSFKKLTSRECEVIISKISTNFNNYISLRNKNHFITSISANLTSIISIVLIRSMLKDNQSMEVLYLPCNETPPQDFDITISICEKLGIKMKTVPIKFLTSTAKNLILQTFGNELASATLENIKNELRSVILTSRCQSNDQLIINDIDKTDLFLGRLKSSQIQYEEINLLANLLKTELNDIALYINTKNNNLIPESLFYSENISFLNLQQSLKLKLSEIDYLIQNLDNKLEIEKANIRLTTNEEEKKIIHILDNNEYKRLRFSPIMGL